MVSRRTDNGNSAAGNGKGSRGMAKGPSEDKARLAALERALAQISKTFGKGAIMRLDEEASQAVPGISTGALSLDLALGGRGLPRSRVV